MPESHQSQNRTPCDKSQKKQLALRETGALGITNLAYQETYHGDMKQETPWILFRH